MTMRLVLAAVLACVLAAPVSSAAQNRRSPAAPPVVMPPPPPPAPLPPREIPPPPDILTSVRADAFGAAPDTYIPKRPEELGLFFPQPLTTVWPVWGSGWGSGYYPEMYRRAGEVRPEPPTMRIVVEHVVTPGAAVAPVPSPATLPAAAPPPAGHKRTLYVIPGCYAGDKLPRRDQLRAGCSLRNLRTISPAL